MIHSLPRLKTAAAGLERAGPFLLGVVTLTGVFARGWANLAFALLALWGLAVLIHRPWRPRNRPAPPARWAAGLTLFTLAWLAAIIAGGHYWLGFKALAKLLFLLTSLPLAWLAFNRRPQTLDWLCPLWGLGLITAAGLTFQEGGYRLICLRAKAHLGTIELGSVLGQLTPLMTGALLRAVLASRKKETVFFALALAAGVVAITQNCSRQTLLAAPFLGFLMLWAYRRRLHSRQLLAIAVLVGLVAGGLFLKTGGLERFTRMVNTRNDQAVTLDLNNSNDTVRLAMWRLGWDVFKEHPLLGVGPAALPRLNSQGENFNHAHHVFLNLLAETGLVGLMGFLALHLAPLTLIWPHRHSGNPATFFWVWVALVVNFQFFLNGLTDQIFSLKPMMYIHWTVTAAALWQIDQNPAEP